MSVDDDTLEAGKIYRFEAVDDSERWCVATVEGTNAQGRIVVDLHIASGKWPGGSTHHRQSIRSVRVIWRAATAEDFVEFKKRMGYSPLEKA